MAPGAPHYPEARHLWQLRCLSGPGIPRAVRHQVPSLVSPQSFPATLVATEAPRRVLCPACDSVAFVALPQGCVWLPQRGSPRPHGLVGRSTPLSLCCVCFIASLATYDHISAGVFLTTCPLARTGLCAPRGQGVCQLHCRGSPSPRTMLCTPTLQRCLSNEYIKSRVNNH